MFNFRSCPVIVYVFVVYLVLLNVGCFLSLGVGLCSGCDGWCAFLFYLCFFMVIL